MHSDASRARSSYTTSGWPSRAGKHSRIRLVLFDAFDTLLKPRKPPHEQYAEEARVHLSGILPPVALTDEAVKASFQAAFKRTWKEHPLYGAHTGLVEKRWPDEWWRLVIERTFPLDETSKGTDTDAARSRSITRLQDALLDRFASSKAYELFEDTLPAFQALQDMTVQVGIASNSDSRILDAMRALRLDHFVNLDLEGPGNSASAESSAITSRGPPPILSYSILAEKPSRKFFEIAVQRATSYMSAASSASSQHGNSDALKRSQVLFIGDHLLEDFRGARDAGLQSLWIRRGFRYSSELQSTSRKGPGAHRSESSSYDGPHNEEAERIFKKEGLTEEERTRVVTSLGEAVQWLKRYNGDV
ncbi:hypothetical protein K437DRAFT_263376 [Tilletiaria anomala UBC 951]|uniref:HAD-like protein n=1 Tax=Tilletiaria anomala (strain ATCC 24038 / CBS 436.72 / UBC 951) TaxID=1037660 RepID=A0A066VQE2_TILAU|nr:uncharacterized protein K437DRAFT_263376 [Tilletiaria anomala UBC 951]KDN43947.1 hypothetical protein K437DRAFT_263376 [Tilletiaria anomala UBC 951]